MDTKLLSHCQCQSDKEKIQFPGVQQICLQPGWWFGFKQVMTALTCDPVQLRTKLTRAGVLVN
jgi:hypothetical protein